MAKVVDATAMTASTGRRDLRPAEGAGSSVSKAFPRELVTRRMTPPKSVNPRSHPPRLAHHGDLNARHIISDRPTPRGLLMVALPGPGPFGPTKLRCGIG